MSRQKRRSKSDVSDVTDGSRDSEVLNDVVLIVEGKKIPANGGILSYNSSVLGDMITTLGDLGGAVGTGAEFGDIGSTLVSRDTYTPRGRAPVEVVLKDQSYGSVKTMMGFLQAKCNMDALSGETALQLLPLTETFKMSRLRKRCGTAILDELKTMQDGKPAGTITTSVTLKYLPAAEKYGLDKVKALCIEGCSANFDATARKDIADDEHISDKTKAVILDKMCDKMSAFYNKSLEKMKKSMESRYNEIEERRQKYVEATEAWKRDLQEEVENIIQAKSYRTLYEHLLEQLEKSHKNVDKNQNDLSTLKTKVDDTIEPLERLSNKVKEAEARAKEAKEKGEENVDPGFIVDEVINEEVSTHLSNISDSISDAAMECGAYTRQTLKSSEAYFTEALKNFDVGLFQESLKVTCELQDCLDAMSAELDDRMKEVSELEALYEKEKLQHEKTRAQLVKQMKKVHQINTWLKWAKPIEEDGNRCTCFRHVAKKKQVIT